MGAYLQTNGPKINVQPINRIILKISIIYFKGFLGFFAVLYSTLLHLPPLRFHCVGGCWDRTHDCYDFGIGSQLAIIYLQQTKP
jgi:hypothetical protein